MEEQEILSVSNLQTDVQTHNGFSPLIKDIYFQVKKGKILGIVGESGCGKTITSMSILQLHNKQTMHVKGSIKINGLEVNGLEEKKMRLIRGSEVAFIMQNPMSAFTPVFTIGQQFIETLRTHLSLSKKEAVELATETMQNVSLKDPKDLLKKYPFELSGGMLQRVMIAITASLKPSLIIADEPTTSLDLSSQVRVLRLLEKLRRDFGTSILLISHDLGVISEMADDVVVMQKGQIVESAPVLKIFDHPMHEYTKRLLRNRPSLYAEGHPYFYSNK